MDTTNNTNDEVERTRQEMERVVAEAMKHDPYDPYWTRVVDDAREKFSAAVAVDKLKKGQKA